MKKIILLLLLMISIVALTACQLKDIIYSDDLPMTIESDDEEIKILQITDLHLTQGISYTDRQTFKLIEALNEADDYDLIVITGDLTMSPLAPSLYKALIKHMESLETPWTFVFGNHDTDFNSYQKLLSLFDDTHYLYFKIGPELEDGGYGNFQINFTYQNEIIYTSYFLDSKAELEDTSDRDWAYDSLSTGQVNWYKTHVSNDTVDSIVYMHIPLKQYENPTSYEGNFLEDKVYAQGEDTGFFDAMLQYGRSQAVFVGHDHLNDFITYKDDIMLAYGRISGYSAYGYLERGGRVVSIINNEITTYLVVESEVM